MPPRREISRLEITRLELINFSSRIFELRREFKIVRWEIALEKPRILETKILKILDIFVLKKCQNILLFYFVRSIFILI